MGGLSECPSSVNLRRSYGKWVQRSATGSHGTNSVQGAVLVPLHGFIKKSQKTPKADFDLA
jgi:hypothetical protein